MDRPADHLDVHATIDGCVLKFHGEEVACWQTLTGAARGLTAAKEALVMLDNLLTRKAV